jgi:methionine synthase II (cobalamin-independent)
MTAPRFFGAPTVVGSFPHTDAEALVARLLAQLPELPAWPQLPVRDWRESMYVQYSEGLPGAVLDQAAQRLWFDKGPGFDEALERFYQAVLDQDVEHFGISRDYALGLHLFLEEAGRRGRLEWAKGQVTGPFSFSMTVTDAGKRSLAYSPEFQEIAAQGIAMKARWMARRLRAVAADALVVLDEPYLCSFGSAFVNVSRDEVVSALETAVAAIHEEGALAGLHCCGNTDWSLVLATGVDALNLDAYQYFYGLPLYPNELAAFLERGGVLMWGMVPASGPAEALDAETLQRAFDERVAALAAKGLDRRRLREQAIVTPSCGMGTQTAAAADRVTETLVTLAGRLRASV